jgi:hypothetical protein
MRTEVSGAALGLPAGLNIMKVRKIANAKIFIGAAIQLPGKATALR